MYVPYPDCLMYTYHYQLVQFVLYTMPPGLFPEYNNNHENPTELLINTHEAAVKGANDWLSKTAESCSVVTVLVASVAFTTASTVPGGTKQDKGTPTFEDKPPFVAFTISSLIALCSSVTSLVFFLSILASHHKCKDFSVNVPRKLLFAFAALFASIVSMLVSLFGGHTFVLKDDLRNIAYLLYAALCFPLACLAFSKLHLFLDLFVGLIKEVPIRSIVLLMIKYFNEFIKR